MEKVTIEAREVKDDIEPEIIDTSIVRDVKDGEGKSSATITLEFDKPVTGFFNKDGSFDVDKHFTLYEREVLKGNISVLGKVVSAKYDTEDGKELHDVIVVELEGLTLNNKDKDFDYILEIVNFEDYSRNRMYRDYYEFDIKKAAVFKADDTIRISGNKDETEISIYFNRPVDRVRAEDETNYLFRKSATGKPSDISDLDGQIIVERDGKTVTLVLPEFEDAGYKYLEVLAAIRDKDGVKLADSVIYNLETGKMVEKEVVVDPEKDPAITYINNTTAIKEDTVTVNKGVAVGPIKAKIKGYNGKQLVVETYKDGAFVGTTTEPIASDDFTGTATTNVTITNTASAKYEIVVKVLDGTKVVETSTLKVNVLDTVSTATVKFGATSLTAGSTTVLPYGTKVSELTFPANEEDTIATPDITIVPDGTNAKFTAELNGSVLTVAVTAENGDKVTYSYILDVQKVGTVSGTSATAATKTIVVDVKDNTSSTNAIVGLKAADFTITSGPVATATENVLTINTVTENPNGTYTIVVNEAFTATTDGVIVTVDGVSTGIITAN
ncbi:hypothetical protein [Schnuerera ultunensis]|uniref:Uncharacterized protein n=2 Tax=Schnuerera ultunensis TaxID=45497 RepID=A0A1M4PLC3_9FIRM|nr:hypothetical protein [Schnuerera ultunensis]SHD76231.1 protein of unknown function [[Clostridium] ultunense Esp]